MTEYYTGTEEEMQALDDAISANCGWPEGGTSHWDSPKEAVDSGVFALLVPQGKHGFTKEQMNNGITHEIITDVQFPAEEV